MVERPAVQNSNFSSHPFNIFHATIVEPVKKMYLPSGDIHISFILPAPGEKVLIQAELFISHILASPSRSP